MLLITKIIENKKIFIVSLVTIFIILLSHIVVSGRGYDDVTFIPMTATAYCKNGTTASGSHTRRGICASKPEWIGLTAMIYKDNHGELGEFLGYYEIKDTGRSVRNGKVIDIWLPTESECKQFGKKKVLVVLVKGCG